MNRITHLYQLQLGGLEKFDPIERQNGQPCAGLYPVNLDTREGQARIRYWMGCYSEEIAEAYNEFIKQDREKLLEELVDASKFMLNMCLQCGLDYKTVFEGFTTPAADDLGELMSGGRGFLPPNASTITWWFYAHGAVWEAATFLRAQPWRQKLTPVNAPEFLHRITTALFIFFGLVHHLNYSADQFFDKFCSKTQVNHDRVREGR